MGRTDPGTLLNVVTVQLGGAADDDLPALMRGALRPPADSLPAPMLGDRDAWRDVSAPALLSRATAERGTPWPQPLAHDAALVHLNGDRTAWEQSAFARVQRSTRSVIAAAVTGDDGWLAEVLDGVVLLCEQSSWCWPAHDESHAAHGWVLADVTAPVVDLGASEIAAHLAWLDHVVGAELDAAYPGVRARIRHEVRHRVLDPFLARNDWWWLGDTRLTINWTPWIVGNVLTAALRLLDAPSDADHRSRIVSRALVGLDRYVADLPADGAVDEGYQYWWAGAARMLEALDVLGYATADAVDPLSEVPTLRETIAFPYRMHLGGDWVVSVADARARASREQPWRALARAGQGVGDPRAVAFADAQHPVLDADETMNLGRLVLALTDDDRRATAHAPLPARVWLPSTQMLVARETEGTASGLTVVAKGGHNGESHNHNDVGSVIVASDGVPVVVDAGRATYTAQTFGTGRYDLWMMQSDWHSVPLIAGRAQLVGAEHAARDVAAGESALALDIAPAYGLADRLRWRRSVRLDRAARAVIVHDDWAWLDAAPAEPSAVRFLLAGHVTLLPGRARVIPIDSATPLELTWTDAAPAALVTQRLDDPLHTEIWGEKLTRLDIDVSLLDELTVTIRQDCSGGER